ncbi:carboxylesterase family protein [Mycobacterium ulcerans str. Harvey]|uniref:Carboxylesterase family protein n=1 Tax=Mycobacterium ulcerans str. Harvey TaxID=1299332 RepID=A0ABP3AS16_MYCUL|nr:carboxylesterase family protein [Mycobacterium ulcerans str. Harvey]
MGELRFRAPQPPQPWTEIADATAFGPVCPQPVLANMPIDLGAPQDEDCLRLNIWAPANTAPGAAKPVMVWLHGGAYMLGSTSQALYDGRRLASSGEGHRGDGELSARCPGLPGPVVVEPCRTEF